MRSRVSCRSTGIILILTSLLVQVLSDESTSLEEYRFDKFNGRKYQNSEEEPVIRLLGDHTVSKTINMNSNILITPIRHTEELSPVPEPHVKMEKFSPTVEDKLTMQLYAAVILRENMLRVFGHVLYVSKIQISASQYSSLYIIHEALRRNLVCVFDMLPIIHIIQGQKKTVQWKMILVELARNLPLYLKSTAEFLTYEIYGKRFSIKALFPLDVQGLPGFLDHLEPDLIDTCKIISSADGRNGYDESSETTLGRVFVEVLYKIMNGQISFTQRLFAVILMSLPQNGEDPILDENIRYVFQLSKFNLIPFSEITGLKHDATDPYELICLTISKILTGQKIPIIVRESLFYIRNNLRPITVTHINPMHNSIKRTVSNGFNVNLLLSSIVQFDFSPDVVYLRDRLLYFIRTRYVDMRIILDGMNTFIYNNPMDLLIALLTRMQKRIQPSYIEIHCTISALLSSLVLKKEICTFRPSISPSIDVTTILGYLQNPALDFTLRKEADSLYVYILNHPDEFKNLKELIPSEKKDCVLPRQCIINIVTDIKNIDNPTIYKKLQILQLIIIRSYSVWKDVYLNDPLAGNKTDNVIPETADPENDRSKNPLIMHINRAVAFEVPVYSTTTTKTSPLMSSEGSAINEVRTENQIHSSTTTNIPAASTTTRGTTVTIAVNPGATAASTTAATTAVATTDSTTVTTTSTTGKPAQTTTTESQEKSTEPVTLKTTKHEYPLVTPNLPEVDRRCCLLHKGVKPNVEIHVGLNNYGIPWTILGNNVALQSSMEEIVIPSITTLLSPPNIEAPFVEWGTHFKTVILDPLRSIYGTEYLTKIFKTNLQIQNYPTCIALVIAFLEEALTLHEVKTNTKFCLVVEKYIKVINYLSIVLLMPMMSQYNHIKGNVIYSIINDNDPSKNLILENRPTSLAQGSLCFPLLHPKYYLLAIDQENPYAGLLPELSSGFGDIEYLGILKTYLVTEKINKLIGFHFNPLAYPNRGTLFCGILQALSKIFFVQGDAKLSYVVTGYLKAIRSWVMYTKIPSSFILSFPVYGSNEVPSENWKPDLSRLISMLPPARTLTEIDAKKQLKLVLAKANLLDMIGVPKPTVDTKGSVLLIQIIKALVDANNVWISPILMPVLKIYVQMLETNTMFDATIPWFWVNGHTKKPVIIMFDETIYNCLVYDQLPHKAKIAYNSMIEYFNNHPHFLHTLPSIGSTRKPTQGLYLHALFTKHLQNNKIPPSVKHDLEILIPYINIHAGPISRMLRKKMRRMGSFM